MTGQKAAGRNAEVVNIVDARRSNTPAALSSHGMNAV